MSRFILLDDLLAQHPASATLSELFYVENLRLAVEIDSLGNYIRLVVYEGGEFIQPSGGDMRRSLANLDRIVREIFTSLKALHRLEHSTDETQKPDP